MNKILAILLLLSLVVGCGSDDALIRDGKKHNDAYETMVRDMKSFRAGSYNARMLVDILLEVRDAVCLLQPYVDGKLDWSASNRRTSELERNAREVFYALVGGWEGSLEQYDAYVEEITADRLFGIGIIEPRLYREKVAIKQLVKKGAEIKSQPDCDRLIEGGKAVGWLDLEKSSVDDSDLELLKCLVSLSTLSLHGKISGDGVRELQKTLSWTHVSPGR